MMKTKNIVLTSLVLAASFLSVAAQEPTSQAPEFKSKAGQNWFISIGAGPNLLIGEQDATKSIGDRIQLGGELSVGKWFNYNFGMRMQVYGGSLKGFNYLDSNKRGGQYTRSDRSRDDFPTGYPDKLDKVDGSEGPGFWQKFNAMSASFDLMLNLTNLFRGYYREQAPIDLIPFIGFGYQHAFESNTNPVFYGLVGKAGARLNFNLSNKFSIYVEPQVNITSSEFDGYIGNRDIELYTAALVGVQLTINKDFSNQSALSQDEVNVLNNRINEQRQLLDNQQDILERQQKMIKELKEDHHPVKGAGTVPNQQQQQQVTNSKNYLPEYIRFGISSSTVAVSEKHKVEDAAAYLKANPQSKLLLIGYSDKKTGNSKYNYTLSCKRVDSVANQLKSMGIDANRLIIQCVGDKEQPYDQNDWNRVVIMVERK